jgi:glucosamine 6-phosphate synthetase-like amidotransferase/phosphosugar isomerase protein
MTELQIFMNFDEEVSVTSKSYVCTLLLLYVMAKTIIGEFYTNETEIQNVEAFLGEIRSFLQDQKQINKLWKEILSSFGYDIDFLEILSRGPSLTSAHQAALNFKEIVKSYSEASSISTFRHIQFIDKLVNEWACGKILHITNQEFDEKAKKLHDDPKIVTYKHKIKDPHLAPIMEIIILQLLFYKMAEKKGIEPGVFKYSRKITDDL